MKHVVRPVLIAFADTIFPANIKELCRESFKHIQRYFLEEIGITSRVAEPVITRTHLTAEYFEKRKGGDISLPEDLAQSCQERLGPKYRSRFSDLDFLCLNLVLFVRQKINADNTQAWVIFIPIVAKENFWYTALGLRIGVGGYAIISAHLLTHWVPDGRAEGRIAHELSHIFGLDHNQEAAHRLMNRQDNQRSLTECTLNQKERWILSRSPFFTEKEL